MKTILSMVENRSTVHFIYVYVMYTYVYRLANKFGYIFLGMEIKFSCFDDIVISAR